jgi:Uma2 family endonuclease
VVELKSSSDTLSDLKVKIAEYTVNGSSLGFLIERKPRRVHVYRPGQGPDVLDNPEAVSGEPELPGFVLQMARIW